MTCPRCGGTDVKIQFIETSAKTRTRKAGCLWRLGRWCLIVCTGGLWLLIGRRKSTSNTKIRHAKRAICQSCGHAWSA